LYDRNLQRKTNKKSRKLAYEVWNHRNLQTKQIKKHVSPSSLAHFHLTKYDVINTYAVFGTNCRQRRNQDFAKGEGGLEN